MSCQISKKIKTLITLIVFSTSLFLNHAVADCKIAGNFGLPGIADLDSFVFGWEVVVTQQLHKSLARSGISFQALPRVGFSFRYTGHGINGGEAYGRVNHDRSFDAHIPVIDEEDTFQQYL